nr:immunoglobulin light chain junction region [Macaca mulatta]
CQLGNRTPPYSF